jgi:uncharacterized protein (DUF433 family)
MMNYKSMIPSAAGKRSNKPYISGVRITVYDILSYLSSGMTHKQILDDFPSLTEDDISDSLSYAPDVHSFLFG